MCKSWLSPEKQMFTKFLNLQHLDSLNVHLQEDFLKLVLNNPFLQPSKPFHSVAQTSIDGLDIVQQIYNHSCEVSSVDASIKCYHSVSYPRIEKVFNDRDMHLLKEMYQLVYPSTCIKMSRFFIEVKQISVHGLQ